MAPGNSVLRSPVVKVGALFVGSLLGDTPDALEADRAALEVDWAAGGVV